MKSRATSSTAALERALSPVVPLTGGEWWLRIWYHVICQLPASWGCDAHLVIDDGPVMLPDGTSVHGTTAMVKGVYTIHVSQEVDHHDSLATLIHEVAHVAANPRHKRHHGYSWRRALAEICRELTGEDPTPRAIDLRRRMRATMEPPPRSEVLDVAVTELLVRNGPWLYWCERRQRMEAWMGERRYLVPASKLPRVIVPE